MAQGLVAFATSAPHSHSRRDAAIQLLVAHCLGTYIRVWGDISAEMQVPSHSRVGYCCLTSATSVHVNQAMPSAVRSEEAPASNEVAGKESAPASASGDGLVDSEGYGSSDEHIFTDPAVANYWRDVFQTAGYENRHRFDPSFTWSAEEERKLVRKIDLRIMLW